MLCLGQYCYDTFDLFDVATSSDVDKQIVNDKESKQNEEDANGDESLDVIINDKGADKFSNDGEGNNTTLELSTEVLKLYLLQK